VARLEFLRQSAERYDLIYADAWPGKFSHLDEDARAFAPRRHLLHRRPVAADWPDGHAPKVPVLIDDIERRGSFVTVRLVRGSGLMLVVRSE
jgi:hypothetical protein